MQGHAFQFSRRTRKDLGGIFVSLKITFDIEIVQLHVPGNAKNAYTCRPTVAYVYRNCCQFSKKGIRCDIKMSLIEKKTWV